VKNQEPRIETWATKRLDQLVLGAEPPPVIKTLQLGTLDSWGLGWAKKTWTPSTPLLNVDGSAFGGYIAALADQILAFAAMTVVPNEKTFRTSNLNVSFFRVVKERLQIEGKVIAQSRQVIHVRAEFRLASGELVAEATALQLVQG
jgi:uncharacterized protein (TIGR00369 family)